MGDQDSTGPRFPWEETSRPAFQYHLRVFVAHNFFSWMRCSSGIFANYNRKEFFYGYIEMAEGKIRTALDLSVCSASLILAEKHILCS